MVAQYLGVQKQLFTYYFWNPVLGLQSSGIDDRPARATAINIVDYATNVSKTPAQERLVLETKGPLYFVVEDVANALLELGASFTRALQLPS
jgi:hypothetical protein